MVNLTKKAAAANGGIAEGDYTSWTWQWTNDIPGGLFAYNEATFFIDDKNDVLYLVWRDAAGKRMFGLYNLSDFSPIFEPTPAANYLSLPPDALSVAMFKLGDIMLAEGGGLSRSLQTYVLLVLNDEETIEVWRGGLSALWSRNITLDTTGITPYAGEISLTGKYIVVRSDADDLILYEGS